MQKRKFNECNLAANSLMHRLISMIIQVGFFAGSIFFLFITMIVVSAGWGKTCATYKNITRAGITPNSEFNIDCTRPQYSYRHGPYPPNGTDFITAAVSY